MSNFPLDVTIYPEDIVTLGIKDFEEYVTIEYRDGLLSIMADSPREIYLEFMNYLIGLYNQK